jgi:hypothetical protein
VHHDRQLARTDHPDLGARAAPSRRGHPRAGAVQHRCALAAADEAEFSAVRDSVEVSDSVLSWQVGTLEAAGYVKVRKGYVGKRPRTWLSLTTAGRAAYERHLAARRAIATGQV